MTKFRHSITVSLLSMGIVLGILSQDLVSGFPHNEEGSSKSVNSRTEINRSSKDNGFSAVSGEYTARRPYKADLHLLRLFDRSYELGMPVLRNNDLDGDRDTEYFLALDPTLRSKRRKRQVKQQLQHHHQQVIQSSSDSTPTTATSNIQQHSLCSPIFNINSLCRQMFFGVPSNANGHLTMFSPQHATPALAVPSSSSSAIILPPAFSSPSSSSSISNNNNALPVQFLGVSPFHRNELAIMNYYQQQFPLQVPALQPQDGVFQGPAINERQRQQYENIHTKFPYPYPPTDVNNPNTEAGQPGAVNPGQDSNANNDAGATTDYPSDNAPAVTNPPSEQPEQPQQGQDQDDPALTVSKYPDSSYNQQPPIGGIVAQQPPQPISSAQAPPPQNSAFPSSPAAQANIPQPQQIQEITQALKQQVREKDDEIRRIQAQLDQANLQVVAYEQENAVYKEFKDQYVRAEDANVKLRDRVLQLENTNQHLQEQYGQLQQVNAEQRQQINSLKDSQKELMNQIENVQSQMTPLNKEIQAHRKEIEDFLIRIRKLGEESETCQKQVKLYQLKINYILGQQEQQKKQQQQSAQVPEAPSSPPKTPQSAPVQRPVSVVAHNDDDELDPELMRMDAEIAALQKNAENIAAAIRNLPQPPQSLTLASSATSVPTSQHEFRGEAIQVNPLKNKSENNNEAERAPSASRNLPTWEKPSGF